MINFWDSKMCVCSVSLLQVKYDREQTRGKSE